MKKQIDVWEGVISYKEEYGVLSQFIDDDNIETALIEYLDLFEDKKVRVTIEVIE